ncbi:hypothetical protein Vadar_005956 [Vaccinium darrowii]|uniref:Uncharacterized protein n=1 Tax=Vaccinium darrowii TaxID=229202 RepID=A0ACB7WYG7_9ERIC|nr:hypothetical protein Vadar_005956 [Vaccinium darrowii]
MEGSTAATSSRSSHGESELFCGCGIKSPLRVSKSEQNWGRRFYGCVNYKTKLYCGFFVWEDTLIGSKGTESIDLQPSHAELQRTISDLQRINSELQRTNAELQRTNAELQRTNSESQSTNYQFCKQVDEMERRIEGLKFNNKELQEQNKMLKLTISRRNGFFCHLPIMVGILCVVYYLYQVQKNVKCLSLP